MLKLAYFADDFTGATDALEALAQAGLRCRLFLDPPTATQCAGLDAIGVAGLTRSLAPDAMEAVLRPAFGALRALAPRHVHYKVCSTFDSSPTVGSIGRAIDVGASVFGSRRIPLLVAAPNLGRYCAFGNLYARFGIGSEGAVYRLDRHPSVSRHPVTPMTEADLRLHLGRQTSKPLGLLSVPELELPFAECAARLQRCFADGIEVILIDGLNATHLERAGALIDGLAGTVPLFSVGSSGIEAALTAHWATQTGPARAVTMSGNEFEKIPVVTTVGASPLLVVSGSCSPVTGGQIGWALDHGFVGIASGAPQATSEAIAALRSGKSVVVYSSRGETSSAIPASELGAQLGALARETIAAAGVKRLVLAGGDTSSYAARALGLESLQLLAPLVPGAPLCRARAPGSPADGLEINFKGGQVGAPDYFGTAARGPL